MDRPNGETGAAKPRLEMLLDFLVEWVKPHFELAERLVAALWKKAECGTQGDHYVPINIHKQYQVWKSVLHRLWSMLQRCEQTVTMVGQASCLEDWEAMTSLLLESDLTADQHMAAAYLAEAGKLVRCTGNWTKCEMLRGVVWKGKCASFKIHMQIFIIDERGQRRPSVLTWQKRISEPAFLPAPSGDHSRGL